MNHHGSKNLKLISVWRPS